MGKLRRRSDQHASGTGNNKIQFLLGYNFSTLLFSFKRQIKLWTESSQMKIFTVCKISYNIQFRKLMQRSSTFDQDFSSFFKFTTGSIILIAKFFVHYLVELNEGSRNNF